MNQNRAISEVHGRTISIQRFRRKKNHCSRNNNRQLSNWKIDARKFGLGLITHLEDHLLCTDNQYSGKKGKGKAAVGGKAFQSGPIQEAQLACDSKAMSENSDGS